MWDELAAPPDIGAHPRELLAALEHEVGEVRAAHACVALLSGADARDWATALPYLGGRPAQGLLDGVWPDYWARVWGARGLRYVWVPEAQPTVVGGLDDEAWRVAEMCVKVAGLRDIAEAGDGAAALTRHELPRVRAAGVRTLGLVGDSEHVEAVDSAVDDPSAEVRRAAATALRRLAARLDRPDLV